MNKKILTGIILAVLAAAAAILLIPKSKGNSQIEENISGAENSIEESKPQLPPPPSSPSPMGVRENINFNGLRYEILNKDNVLSEESLNLKESLGKTEEIPERASQFYLDNFKNGAEIFSLEEFDPYFRFAVKGENGYFLCQNTGSIEDSVLDLNKFLKESRILENAQGIDIFDHMGIEVLESLDKETADNMIELLSDSKHFKPTNEEYEKIAGEQSRAGSFKLSVNFENSEPFRFYILPKLKTAMIGDGKYILSDEFLSQFESTFSNLKETAPPVN